MTGVLYVTARDRLCDERLEKAVKSLVDSGIKTTVLMLVREDIPSHFKMERLMEKTNVVRIPYSGRSYGLFRDLKCYLKSGKYVKENDAIYVANPPDTLVIPYFVLAKIFGKKIYFEMQDNWYLSQFAFSDRKTLGLRYLRLKEWLAHRFVARCDRVMVFSDEMVKYMTERGIAREKIMVVENKGDLELLSADPKDVEKARQEYGLEGKKIVSYIGLLQDFRGVDVLTESIKYLKDKRDDFRLLLVTNTEDSVGEKIKGIIKKYDLSSHVVLTGWQDNRMVPVFFQMTDIGVLPWKDTLHIRSGLANKFFNYLLLKKCLIHPDLSTVKKYYNGKNFLLFKAGDPKDLAEKIDYALDHCKEIQENIGDVKAFEWNHMKFAGMFKDGRNES